MTARQVCYGTWPLGFAHAAEVLFSNAYALSPDVWIYGQSPCATSDSYVALAPIGDNPCGIEFTLDNGFSYSLQGCGSTIYVLNGDGSFNSVCTFDEGTVGGCDGLFTQGYVCG